MPNERISQYSISGSNLNVNKILYDLSQCGVYDARVKPDSNGHTILVNLRNPSPEQLARVQQILNCKADFQDFRNEFTDFRNSFFDQW